LKVAVNTVEFDCFLIKKVVFSGVYRLILWESPPQKMNYVHVCGEAFGLGDGVQVLFAGWICIYKSTR